MSPLPSAATAESTDEGSFVNSSNHPRSGPTKESGGGSSGGMTSPTTGPSLPPTRELQGPLLSNASTGNPTTSLAAPSDPSTFKGKSSKTCQNVIRYGHCKFEKTKCPYKHPTSPPLVLSQPPPNLSTSPIFRPPISLLNRGSLPSRSSSSSSSAEGIGSASSVSVDSLVTGVPSTSRMGKKLPSPSPDLFLPPNPILLPVPHINSPGSGESSYGRHAQKRCPHPIMLNNPHMAEPSKSKRDVKKSSPPASSPQTPSPGASSGSLNSSDGAHAIVSNIGTVVSAPTSVKRPNRERSKSFKEKSSPKDNSSSIAPNLTKTGSSDGSKKESSAKPAPNGGKGTAPRGSGKPSSSSASGRPERDRADSIRSRSNSTTSINSLSTQANPTPKLNPITAVEFVPSSSTSIALHGAPPSASAAKLNRESGMPKASASSIQNSTNNSIQARQPIEHIPAKVEAAEESLDVILEKLNIGSTAPPTLSNPPPAVSPARKLNSSIVINPDLIPEFVPSTNAPSNSATPSSVAPASVGPPKSTPVKISRPLSKMTGPSIPKSDTPPLPMVASEMLSSSLGSPIKTSRLNPQISEFIPTAAVAALTIDSIPEFIPSSHESTVIKKPEPEDSVTVEDIIAESSFAQGDASFYGQHDAEDVADDEAYLYPEDVTGQSALDQYFFQHGETHQLEPLPKLQHHLYRCPLPHTASHSHFRSAQQAPKAIHAFYIADELREHLVEKLEDIQQINHTDPTIPEHVGQYHSLVSLDAVDKESETDSSLFFGYPTALYKAISSITGSTCALRRVKGFRLLDESTMSRIDRWKSIRHSGIVSVQEAFTTKAFSDHSLVIVYDYHPMSRVLTHVPGLPESTLWSYIIQLASALHKLHFSGLAARVISNSSKVLMTDKNRIRLNGCGILDIVGSFDGKTVTMHQQEDLVHLGHLIVALVCGPVRSSAASRNIDNMFAKYSPDLKVLTLYLLGGNPNSSKSIQDIMRLLAPRMMHDLDQSLLRADVLEGSLLRELENGRLARLMIKLGFIHDRPLPNDDRWADTGDRYLIKLFRDYVFHQVDGQGKAILDIGHVVSCLNKLDVGVDERVLLTSRDDETCLIVSYKELKKCIEQSFKELL